MAKQKEKKEPEVVKEFEFVLTQEQTNELDKFYNAGFLARGQGILNAEEAFLKSYQMIKKMLAMREVGEKPST